MKMKLKPSRWCKASSSKRTRREGQPSSTTGGHQQVMPLLDMTEPAYDEEEFVEYWDHLHRFIQH